MRSQVSVCQWIFIVAPRLSLLGAFEKAGVLHTSNQRFALNQGTCSNLAMVAVGMTKEHAPIECSEFQFSSA